MATGSLEVSNMAVVQLWLSECRKPMPPNSPMIAGLVASGGPRLMGSGYECVSLTLLTGFGRPLV